MARPTNILMAHGGGGQLSAELIAQVILPAVGGQDVRQLTDAATVTFDGVALAFTTDSYIVVPLEFPGGDIGKLAICGTVNDLAVSGARPVALSLALVLEEGLEIALLSRVLVSAGKTAEAVGVPIVTGDTKVVDRRPGSADGGGPGLTINTAGVGAVLGGAKLGFDRVGDGDAVILSGPLGQHGMAIMAARQKLSFAASLSSDCAPLHELCAELVGELGAAVKWMRDPTRGGLAAALADLSVASGRNIEIEHTAIPTDATALAAAEMLGLDLLTVANEGKLVAVVAADAAQEAVKILARHDIARKAAAIGHIGEQADMPLVELLTRAGGRRIIQMPYGEDLPRIC